MLGDQGEREKQQKTRKGVPEEVGENRGERGILEATGLESVYRRGGNNQPGPTQGRSHLGT